MIKTRWKIRTNPKTGKRERIRFLGSGFGPEPHHPFLSTLDIDTPIEEYLIWGENHGGRLGGWIESHRRRQEDYLTWWKQKLNLKKTSDLIGILPQVEAVLGELKRAGFTGNTINKKATTLKGFCRWAHERGYLPEHPLKGLRLKTPVVRHVRRALTAEEVERLLRVAKPERRKLYELAILTGLRAGELRRLEVRDLDRKRPVIHIRREVSKARRDEEVQLPRWLWERWLAETEGKRPSAALLPDMTTNPARSIQQDFRKAGILWRTEDGKVDFHALRTAYVTFLIETGANIKVVQSMARHTDARLTLNTYARARREQLEAAAEQISEKIGMAV